MSEEQKINGKVQAPASEDKAERSQNNRHISKCQYHNCTVYVHRYLAD